MKTLKISIFYISPRKKSNSKLITEYILKHLKNKYKIKKKIFDINKYKIKSCNACDECRKKLKCILKDDFDFIIKNMKADIFIVASPIYFTGVPAQFKAFIDRNQVMWYKYIKGKLKSKGKGIIILTAGENKKKYFYPAESEIRSFFTVNNIKTIGVLKLGNLDEEGIGLKKYKNKIDKFLKNLKI